MLYRITAEVSQILVSCGGCIPVASASPIDVPPVQCVLKHCGAHKHIIINKSLYSTAGYRPVTVAKTVYKV